MKTKELIRMAETKECPDCGKPMEMYSDGIWRCDHCRRNFI